MNNELEFLYQTLKKAKNPEEVFGILAGTIEDKLSACTKTFRHLVALAHPDHFLNEEDKKVATEAFKLLQPFYEAAKQKIQNGTYGDLSMGVSTEPVHITTKRNAYELGSILFTGSISDIFKGQHEEAGIGKEILIKVARSYKNNDFISNESTVLKKLGKESHHGLEELIPKCIDSFIISDTATRTIRRANVFDYKPDLVNLAYVIKKYPGGIDPKDMAWMFKRILVAIWVAHEQGIVHGAVLPQHILLNLVNHGILLIDWSFSAKISETYIKAIDSTCKDFYPLSVFDKEVATPEVDIYMAAVTIIKLLGGDSKTKIIPNSVPKEIRSILRACILEHSGFTAMEIHEEFNQTIKKLFGPPKFRNFQIK